MSKTKSTVKKEKVKVSSKTNKRIIENHKKIADHLESAAKHHVEAANHFEKENHDKAAQSTIAAHGHTALAHEAQKEDIKSQALKNEVKIKYN